MTREVPSPAMGWRVGARVFATPSQAYYEIAKRLVVAKYPPLLHRDYGPEQLVAEGWGEDLIDIRTQKAEALFMGGEWRGDFLSERWVKFVRRVARYLRFVDKRRGLRDLDEATLAGDVERAERESCALGDYSIACKRELDRRAAAADRGAAG